MAKKKDGSIYGKTLSAEPGKRRENEVGRPILNKEDMYFRRELVYHLHSRGVPFGDIVRRIQGDPNLKHLLDGYSMPLYRLVKNDYKWYAHEKVRSQLIPKDVQKSALAEYTNRMDVIFDDVFAYLENQETPVNATDAEALMGVAMKAAQAKAKALGVDLETARIDDPSAKTQNLNFLFGTPDEFMKFMTNVKQAQKLPVGEIVEGELVGN
ncbi:hypothetical protein LCGC14_1502120 [marine sediment metagenome]|uniref:Uncharacterized protein n=1 Tax=marine sediment metagenome TaxID=412755 RepID=A0A0F9LJG7_9ZZZZ